MVPVVHKPSDVSAMALFDQDAERTAIGHILLRPDHAAAFAALTPEDFLSHACVHTFTAIQSLIADGREPNLLNVKPLVADRQIGPGDLAALVDECVGAYGRFASADALVDRLHTLTLARRTHRLLKRAQLDLEKNPHVVTNGFFDHLQTQLTAAGAVISTDADWRSVPLSLVLSRHADLTRQTLLGELLARNEVALFHGQPRDGKSWIALDCALALVTGTCALGLLAPCGDNQTSALIVGNEDREQVYADRARQLLLGRGLSPDVCERLHLWVNRGVYLDDPVWQHRLLEEIQRLAIGLVVIDPLRSVTAGADQGPRELRPIAMFLRRLLSETDVGVLVVHHDTKPIPGVTDTRRTPQRASGGGIFSIADAPVHVQRLDEGHVLLTPSAVKHTASDPPPLSVAFERLEDGGLRLVATVASAPEANAVLLDERIVAFLRARPEATTSGLTRGVQARGADVREALGRLMDQGRVDSRPGRRGGTLWFLAGQDDVSPA